jgi:hypothetical protein
MPLASGAFAAQHPPTLRLCLPHVFDACLKRAKPFMSSRLVMVLPLRLATSENLIKQFISSLHTPPPNSLKPSVGVLIGVALPES